MQDLLVCNFMCCTVLADWPSRPRARPRIEGFGCGSASSLLAAQPRVTVHLELVPDTSRPALETAHHLAAPAKLPKSAPVLVVVPSDTRWFQREARTRVRTASYSSRGSEPSPRQEAGRVIVVFVARSSLDLRLPSARRLFPIIPAPVLREVWARFILALVRSFTSKYAAGKHTGLPTQTTPVLFLFVCRGGSFKECYGLVRSIRTLVDATSAPRARLGPGSESTAFFAWCVQAVPTSTTQGTLHANLSGESALTRR
jgi:hypothetical protein